MSDTVLAIDLGTSAIKLIAVDPAGTILARQRIPHTSQAPSPDAAEQRPDDWWQHMVEATAALTRSLHNDHRFVAIGVTGQMHGLVLYDARDLPLQPAMTWQDRRSASTLPALLDRVPTRPSPIAPGYQAASWHWLTTTRPNIAASAKHILLPKDDIIFRLTGRHVTDPSDAIGTGWYDPASRTWDAAMVDAAGASLALLPTILPSGSVVGTLRARAAIELGLDPGVPVIIAGGDAAAAAFGAGATDPATSLIMLSTGCQILEPAWTLPGTGGWPAAGPPGLPPWLRVTTTLNGGNVVAWARSTFGDPAPSIDADLLFLPYLAGERAVPAEASGTFVGLRARHDRADMAAAAIHGVALALAAAYEQRGGAIGNDQPMLVGGGGARDAVWVKQVAAALARPIQVIDEPDLSVWGAARSAATAVGWIDPVRDTDAWKPATRPAATGTSLDRDATVARLRQFRSLARRLWGTHEGTAR